MGESVGDNIRRVRRENKLTQSQLAKIIGVSLNTLNRIECGHRTADANFLTRLGEKLGCDLGQLLGQGEPAAVDTVQTGKAVPVLKLLPADLSSLAPESVDGHLSYPGVPAGAYAVRAADDSMLPAIKAGDWVVFVTGAAKAGDIVVLRDPWGAAHIRRLREVEGMRKFVAESPDYAAAQHHRWELVGRVLRVLREYQF